jgi:ketosteroid isomerase-like protein
MKRSAALDALLLLTLLLAPPLATRAQQRYSEPAPEELSRTLTALDATVFDAFNRCDLPKLGSYFADDLEFYHDKGGLSLTSKSLVEAVKNNICGKVRREVVQGSLEVHPIPGFGAVQLGVHRFYETQSARPNDPVGIARFLHVWQHKDGAWKITRVISYDHGPAPK